MSEIFIIAGPQAAGKSTIISNICSQYHAMSPLFGCPKRKVPPIFPLQESRQVISHKDMLLGAIFMTPEQEIASVQCDLTRMDLILSRTRDHLIYMDECNVFSIAHAAAHGVTEVEKYWAEYIKRLTRLDAKVIFLDVDSEVSWERRKRKYEQRLVYFPANRHAAIMRRYHKYMQNLRTPLLDIYGRLPFPKVMLNGQMPEKDVMLEVSGALIKMSDSLKPLRR